MVQGEVSPPPLRYQPEVPGKDSPAVRSRTEEETLKGDWALVRRCDCCGWLIFPRWLMPRDLTQPWQLSLEKSLVRDLTESTPCLKRLTNTTAFANHSLYSRIMTKNTFLWNLGWSWVGGLQNGILISFISALKTSCSSLYSHYLKQPWQKVG